MQSTNMFKTDPNWYSFGFYATVGLVGLYVSTCPLELYMLKSFDVSDSSFGNNYLINLFGFDFCYTILILYSRSGKSYVLFFLFNIIITFYFYHFKYKTISLTYGPNCLVPNVSSVRYSNAVFGSSTLNWVATAATTTHLFSVIVFYILLSVLIL